MIKGHTLEFRTSSSGSISPWLQDYCHEHNIALFGTSDMCDFVRVDNFWIYRLEYIREGTFVDEYSKENLKEWQQVEDWLHKHARLVDTMDEIKNWLEERLAKKDKKD
jgi:hypothetical protein